MKVFLSWSGDLSQKVACVLRDWLPSVIQTLEPYVSSEDIDKGARWSTDIAKELDQSSYGILCVTKDNRDAPWLNFEAGALSKAVDKARVSPFLFGLKRAEVRGPLLQFQSTIYEHDDIKKLVLSLNAAQEKNRLDEARLGTIFDVWWPRLDAELSKLMADLPAEASPPKKKAEQFGSEILEEILVLVRGQQKILSDPESLLPPPYLSHVLRRYGAGFERDHPAFRDLWERYQELTALVESFDKEGTIPVGVVAEHVVKLGRPLDYIVDRFALLRRPGRSMRRRLTAEGKEESE